MWSFRLFKNSDFFETCYTQFGGVIYVGGGTVTATTCSFGNNLAGGVGRFPNHAVDCVRLFLPKGNSDFFETYYTQRGGVIYAQGDVYNGVTVTTMACSFGNNSATEVG